MITKPVEKPVDQHPHERGTVLLIRQEIVGIFHTPGEARQVAGGLVHKLVQVHHMTLCILGQDVHQLR